MRPLRAGSFGLIFKATWRGTPVAIKQIHIQKGALPSHPTPPSVKGGLAAQQPAQPGAFKAGSMPGVPSRPLGLVSHGGVDDHFGGPNGALRGYGAPYASSTSQRDGHSYSTAGGGGTAGGQQPPHPNGAGLGGALADAAHEVGAAIGVALSRVTSTSPGLPGIARRRSQSAPGGTHNNPTLEAIVAELREELYLMSHLHHPHVLQFLGGAPRHALFAVPLRSRAVAVCRCCLFAAAGARAVPLHPLTRTRRPHPCVPAPAHSRHQAGPALARHRDGARADDSGARVQRQPEIARRRCCRQLNPRGQGHGLPARAQPARDHPPRPEAEQRSHDRRRPVEGARPARVPPPEQMRPGRAQRPRATQSHAAPSHALRQSGHTASRRAHRLLAPRAAPCPRAQVCDFGLSRLLPRTGAVSDDAYRMTGETGSYVYMAPEVYKHESYNLKVDQYAFAMILYQVRPARGPLRGCAAAAAHGAPAAPSSAAWRCRCSAACTCRFSLRARRDHP